MNIKITPDHLCRSAVVYVRQSTMAQVTGNRESQRRQYDLAGAAEKAGFASVTVIDDDLGCSGSGSVQRPGFERLVAMVCSGDVGAVYCIEASRLARNGRDWHHLIDLCALAGAVVIDPDGAYDPRLVNDRLAGDAPGRRFSARSDDETGYRYIAFASPSVATGGHGYGMCRGCEGPERRGASKGRDRQRLRSR